MQARIAKRAENESGREGHRRANGWVRPRKPDSGFFILRCAIAPSWSQGPDAFASLIVILVGKSRIRMMIAVVVSVRRLIPTC